MSSLFHSRSLRVLGIVLCIGLLHGFLFVFLVPPWQHYDEPNHFEYAWLIADRGRLPEPGDYDQQMQRAVAKSMIDHEFFKGLGFLPNLDAQDEPIWIGGYSQLTNLPLYYLLVSVPLRLLPVEDVTRQLYIGRVVSLFLYLLSLLAAWGVARELSPRGHPLRLLAPLTLALLPGYVDLMTSINNDTGAIALFSLVLWGSVRLARRECTGESRTPLANSLLILFATAVLVYLCYLTKETAFFALPVFLLALFFWLFRGPRRRIAWGIFIALLAAGLVSVFSFDDAALWYRATAQDRPTRVASEKAVIGRHVLQLDGGAEVTPAWLVPIFQPVPGATGRGLEGKTYTLGVWMWASSPVQAVMPVLSNDGQQFSSTIDLGTMPQFYAVRVTLSDNNFNRVWVSLAPSVSVPEGGVIVYYDGLVLVDGERPLEEAPSFAGPDGREGTWGGAAFTNLLRNGSAESAGLRFRPWADQLGVKVSPDQNRPSLILTYLLDWSGAKLFYRATADRLFRSFWGLFGWGHVPLAGFLRPYRILLVATAAGIAGGIFALWRNRSCIAWEAVLILGSALLFIWGMTFVRGASYIALPNPYFPLARYAFTAIIPTVLLLSAGWQDILSRASGRLRIPARGSLLVYLLFLAGLDLFAILSIARYYHG